MKPETSCCNRTCHSIPNYYTKSNNALAHGEVGLKPITKCLPKYRQESVLSKLFKKVNFQINTLLILK